MTGLFYFDTEFIIVLILNVYLYGEYIHHIKQFPVRG